MGGIIIIQTQEKFALEWTACFQLVHKKLHWLGLSHIEIACTGKKKKKKTFRSSTCTKRWNTVFKWFVGRLGVGPASWVSLENTATEAKNNIFKPLPFFLLILWHRYWIITDACKLCFSAGSVWGKKPTCTSYHVLSYKTCVRYKIHWCVVLKAPLWEMLCKKSILFWRGIGLGGRDHISQN